MTYLLRQVVLSLVLVLLNVLRSVLWSVPVDGVLTNVALHKPARYTGDETSEWDPSRVVDGNPSFIWSDKSCIFTSTATNNWFVVDLLTEYDVFDIVISNRRHDSEFLANFSVYVSTEKPFPIPGPQETFKGELCFNQSESVPRGESSHQCNSVIRGRYVYLWKPADNLLQLCEFIVKAEEKNVFQWHLNAHAALQHAMSPVYKQRMLHHPTTIQCMVICLDNMSVGPSHVQIDKVTGECQCMMHIPIQEIPDLVGVDEIVDVYQVTID